MLCFETILYGLLGEDKGGGVGYLASVVVGDTKVSSTWNTEQASIPTCDGGM
jgi:hypothetical protein